MGAKLRGMDSVSRLERLQRRDSSYLRKWQAELADHLRLQPEKYVYQSYKRFGSTHAVIAFLRQKVEFYEARIARRQDRIRYATAGIASVETVTVQTEKK